MADVAHDPLVGTALGGRYLVEEASHQEQLGRLYQGVDLSTGALLTLKVLDPRWSEVDAAVHRFRQEAAALAAIAHPHAPRVLDLARHRDLFEFQVRERASGEPLAELIRLYAPLPPPRAAALAAQVGRVLAAAHARRIVHRTVSPRTVLRLDNAERGDFLLLCDWAAALVGLDDVVELPGVDGFVGDLHHLAPEYVARGEASEAGDVYALGAALYALIAAAPPFEGPEGLVLDAHLHRRPLPPSTRIGRRAGWIDELVLAMLDKDPAVRPTAAQVVLELQRGTASALEAPSLLPVGVVAARDTAAAPPARRDGAARRDEALVHAGAVLVVLFLVFLVGLLAVRLASLGGP